MATRPGVFIYLFIYLVISQAARQLLSGSQAAAVLWAVGYRPLPEARAPSLPAMGAVVLALTLFLCARTIQGQQDRSAEGARDQGKPCSPSNEIVGPFCAWGLL